jgi:ABC-type Fe3+/spermidine/putrescine transport system ATPase subunit
MFKGKLQQFDSPNTFYERPGSARVARFFGGINFLEGEKRGNVVKTPLGTFNVNPQEIAEGPVLVTIRPENLLLGQSGDNSIQVRIIDHVYVGTHTRFNVEMEKWKFEVVSQAESVTRFRDGETVPLQFPQDKIWLVPPEEHTFV